MNNLSAETRSVHANGDGLIERDGPIRFCVSDVKYRSVIQAAEELGWKLVGRFKPDERWSKEKARQADTAMRDGPPHIHWIDKGGKGAVQVRIPPSRRV
jgi:hypothetical protein